MDCSNSDVQNGTPIVRMKDGEANMYILAEGALGENPETILLADNAHVLTEINTEPQLVDANVITEELVAGNGQIIEEKLDHEKLEQEQIMEQENVIAAGPDNHSMYTSLPPFEYILHQSDVDSSHVTLSEHIACR